jgi:hypothetical protein
MNKDAAPASKINEGAGVSHDFTFTAHHLFTT